jgi:hypothetical protein
VAEGGVIAVVFRLIFTGVLLVFACMETGWATCTLLTLSAISNELNVAILKRKGVLR